MFQANDGLYFERLDDGAVRIVQTTDGNDPGVANVAFEKIVPAWAWAGAFVSCSAAPQREADGEGQKFLDYHNGVYPLTALIGEPATSTMTELGAVEGTQLSEAASEHIGA